MNYVITSYYGPRSFDGFHYGVDYVFASRVGYYPENGLIIRSTTTPATYINDAGKLTPYRTGIVIVRGQSGLYHLFTHVESDKLPPAGIQVQVGQPITPHEGGSLAGHLHWEVLTNFDKNSSAPIDEAHKKGWTRNPLTIGMDITKGGEMTQQERLLIEFKAAFVTAMERAPSNEEIKKFQESGDNPTGHVQVYYLNPRYTFRLFDDAFWMATGFTKETTEALAAKGNWQRSGKDPHVWIRDTYLTNNGMVNKQAIRDSANAILREVM